MKSYPSIVAGVHSSTSVYVFDKLDGSNVRAEWTRKSGWTKFGRRRGLLDDSNPILKARVPGLILDKYGDALAQVFRERRWQRVVAFFEFHGPSSFAGVHEESEQQTVTLFDVAVHQKGLIEPRTFLKLFGHLDHPAVLHVGRCGPSIQEQVEEGSLPGMTFEGVVAKGAYVSPGRPLMWKWKSRAWLERLKVKCGGDKKLFEQLR